jgi:hypothetical protein
VHADAKTKTAAEANCKQACAAASQPMKVSVDVTSSEFQQLSAYDPFSDIPSPFFAPLRLTHTSSSASSSSLTMERVIRVLWLSYSLYGMCFELFALIFHASF